MISFSSFRAFFSVCALTMALGAAAQAGPTAATLVVGGKVVPFIVSPFIGPNGALYAPVDAVHLLNASFTPNTDNQTVTVTGENNQTITLPYDLVQGRYCVPFQKVANALDASTDWQPSTETLTVRARLLMVRQQGGVLSIYTSYPVYYHVQRISHPSRVFVDLYGLDLAAQPVDIPVDGGNIVHIRSGQMNYNTARITVDIKQGVPFQVESPVATDQVRVALGVSPSAPYIPPPAALPPLPVAQTPPSDGNLPPLPVTPPPGLTETPSPLPSALGAVPGEGLQIARLSVKTDGASTQVLITATGPTKYSTELLDNPPRLAFDLAGATIGDVQPEVYTVGNPFLKDVRCGIYRSGDSFFGRVVVDLQKMTPYTITQQPGPMGGVLYSINFQQVPVPASQGLYVTDPQSLAGKTIVVDPGHGAQDSGAVGIGGVEEKNFTLAIGLKLRQVLEANGATVYMTRDSNTFMPVMDRAYFSNDHHADLFVSIHCNTSGQDNSLWGTTVYYHAQNPVCRQLATDISQAIGAQTPLQDDGIRSDTIRFSDGFGVLRANLAPAVLVECGYVNDEDDVIKLENPIVQEEIAEGITMGMRDFLSGSLASR